MSIPTHEPLQIALADLIMGIELLRGRDPKIERRTWERAVAKGVMDLIWTHRQKVELVAYKQRPHVPSGSADVRLKRFPADNAADREIDLWVRELDAQGALDMITAWVDRNKVSFRMDVHRLRRVYGAAKRDLKAIQAGEYK